MVRRQAQRDPDGFQGLSLLGHTFAWSRSIGLLFHTLPRQNTSGLGTGYSRSPGVRVSASGPKIGHGRSTLRRLVSYPASAISPASRQTRFWVGTRFGLGKGMLAGASRLVSGLGPRPKFDCTPPWNTRLHSTTSKESTRVRGTDGVVCRGRPDTRLFFGGEAEILSADSPPRSHELIPQFHITHAHLSTPVFHIASTCGHSSGFCGEQSALLIMVCWRLRDREVPGFKQQGHQTALGVADILESSL